MLKLHADHGTVRFFARRPRLARTRVGRAAVRFARAEIRWVTRELAETRAQLQPVVPARVMAFWTNVARCETGVRWDWGRYRRPGEGSTYEGGVGFYHGTWQAWARELGLLIRFPHAYMAPPAVQAKVAQYGLTVHHGYWGCLH